MGGRSKGFCKKQRVEMYEGCTKSNVPSYTSDVRKKHAVQAEDCKKNVWF